MLKLLIVKKELAASHDLVSYYACTENGVIPDRFFRYPDDEGELTLTKVFPASEWSAEDAEQVEVWSSETIERELPTSASLNGHCRWFCKLRPVNVKGSNRQIGDRPKQAKTFRLDSDLVEALAARSKAAGCSQVDMLEEALRLYFGL